MYCNAVQVGPLAPSLVCPPMNAKLPELRLHAPKHSFFALSMRWNGDFISDIKYRVEIGYISTSNRGEASLELAYLVSIRYIPGIYQAAPKRAPGSYPVLFGIDQDANQVQIR